jgi:hypothetical protein
MIALIALVVALIYVIFQMKLAFERAIDFAEKTVDEVKESTIGRVESIIQDNKTKIFSSLAMGGATFLLNKLKNSFTGKKKRKSSEDEE